jgi:BirA family biotin operon repressor/biotin-[acetyl-CoA-carboxylase] ligase
MQFNPTKKALLRRLADGGFHSGATLARELGLTRTAVWALVHELESLGLEIHSVRGKGYRLTHPLELLDAGLIRAGLSDAAAASLASLEVHDQLDSTNNELQRGLRSATGSRVCLAECQTAGKGRIGRNWQSPFAGNICLSLLWRFPDHSALAGLSLAVGVAAVRALQAVGAAGIGLKWPNDLLWRGRKLGGILLEVSGEAHGSFAVVIGIGLNGYLPRAWAQHIDQPWSDLREILGSAPLPRNRLVTGLLEQLLGLLAAYPERGLTAVLDEWRGYHCQQGQSACLYLGDQRISGTIAGVDDQGQLLLDTAEGRKTYASGDLRLRTAGD